MSDQVLDSKNKALAVVEFIKDMKGSQPVILEVKGVSSLGDYFVICSAETGVQTRAIYDEVIAQSKKSGYLVHHHEGDADGAWMLVDLFDVIVHIFTESARQYYNLEHLWSDAKQMKLNQPKIKVKRASRRIKKLV